MGYKNRTRADRAQRALDTYIEECNDAVPDPDDVYLTDLLTDLTHLFGYEKFNEAVRMADVHYGCEQKGKE